MQDNKEEYYFSMIVWRKKNLAHVTRGKDNDVLKQTHTKNNKKYICYMTLTEISYQVKEPDIILCDLQLVNTSEMVVIYDGNQKQKAYKLFSF